jgi:hypothetical protein
VGCISIRGPISVRDAFLSGVQLLSRDTFIKDWGWGLGVANSMGFFFNFLSMAPSPPLL